MESLKASFEKELIKKLSQKASGAQSEETVLVRCFKYFDLNNNGSIEAEEFAKAIEKIGIMIPTKQDLDSLFRIYDPQGTGSVEYKAFAAMILNKEVAGTPSKKVANPDDLMDRLKTKLASRGARGIIGLGKQFRIFDDNHSMSLDKYEFSKAMTDYMLGFSEAEVAALFRQFDLDRSGLIEYDEFLRCIRGPMNPMRKGWVAKAFAKLDADGNGYVDINDITGVYTAKTHPDVLSGKKTEQQILLEFLETFETAHNIRNNTAPDHIVTKEEFEEYYNNVSASIDDDDYFALMMTNAWKLDNQTYGKAWAGQSGTPTKNMGQMGSQRGQLGSQRPQSAMQQTMQPNNNVGGGFASRPQSARPQTPMKSGPKNDQDLLKIVRDKIISRGTRSIMGIGRMFKIFDDNGDKQLDGYEMVNAMNDLRLGLDKQEVTRVAKLFDRDGSGYVDYEEFLRTIRGEMNDFRKALAMKAFKIMDKDNSGVIDLSDIKQSYNAKMHPDVKSGKKTEDEVLWDFLETFDTHHQNHQEDPKNSGVTPDEWIEYYNGVSMSCDTDEYFELMMNQAWNLKGDRVTKKGWGGAY